LSTDTTCTSQNSSQLLHILATFLLYTYICTNSGNYGYVMLNMALLIALFVKVREKLKSL